jgi:carbon-monoxide dehydrogenase medium subunit
VIGHEYAFHRPGELGEALELLARLGDGAKVVAGGMSLVPTLGLGLMEPDALISLNHLEGLDAVSESGEHLVIGAMVRHVTVASHASVRRHAPLFAEAAGRIGDVQVRNRGTFGGSFAHADPAADYLPVALVSDARLRLESVRGTRVVDARDFFRGLMTTALEADELLVAVEIPKLDAGVGASYQRLHRVEGSFPIVAAAALAGPGGLRLALGGVGPGPVEVDLDGVSPEDLRLISDAAYEASRDAFGDLNGDARYRRAMARVFATRVVAVAAANAANAVRGRR